MKAQSGWAARVIAIVVLTVTNANAFGAGQARHKVEDPVFGTLFDPSVLKFEPLSDELKSKCSFPLREDDRVFARADSPDGSDIIILPFPKTQDGDAFGAALSIRGDKCEVQEANWVLSGRVPTKGYATPSKAKLIPGFGAASLCSGGGLGDCWYEFRSRSEENTVRALVANAWLRAQQVRGKTADFKAVACKNEVIKGAENAPIILEFLRHQCKKLPRRR